MKKYITLSLLLALASLAARSQSQSSDSTQKKAEIKIMLNLIQQDSMISKTIDATFDAMLGQMKGQIKDPSVAADSGYSRKWDETMVKTRQYSKDMAKRMINEDMVAIYEKYFTLGQIEDFVAFYKSPSGQVMLHRLPDITKEIMQTMSSRYVPEMQQIILKSFTDMANEKAARQ